MDLLPLLVAWHLGALHAHEKVLTVALAFGPFVLLAVVIAVRRRQDAAEAAAADPREGLSARGTRDRPGSPPSAP